jgi:hypothetical protein
MGSGCAGIGGAVAVREGGAAAARAEVVQGHRWQRRGIRGKEGFEEEGQLDDDSWGVRGIISQGIVTTTSSDGAEGANNRPELGGYFGNVGEEREGGLRPGDAERVTERGYELS